MQECPYCLCPISDTDDITTCRVCGTAYHTECMDENGGCAIKNCETLVRPAPVEITVDEEPHTHLVLSRESVESAPEAAPRRTSNPCLKCGIQVVHGEIYCDECRPVEHEKSAARKVWPFVAVGVILTLALLLALRWFAAPRFTPW